MKKNTIATMGCLSKMKICFVCGIEQPIENFYTHKMMLDGHLNKCKDCTKSQVKKRSAILYKNKEYVLLQRHRGREKYERLGYRGKYKITSEQKRISKINYANKFPEKLRAKAACTRLKRQAGIHLHHWSYNDQHVTDCIPLPLKIHLRFHTYLKYDNDAKMYERLDNGELLDTKQKHIEFYESIKNKL